MSSALRYNTFEEITEIHARLSKAFRSGKTRPLAYRRQQLLQLARMIQENLPAIEEALLADLGKPKFETSVTDAGPLVGNALYAVEHLEEWAKPEKPKVDAWRSSWDTTIYYTPKGVVLIISPWNYPWVLTFNPMIGAIAAGCVVVLKPSELVPTCSQLMAELVPKYLDPDAYAIVNGGPAETTHILDLKWDHIFFTGGTKIGRIIAAAAGRSLTPVTLELGGKSPVVIDDGFDDLELAARRTLHGKVQNSGQLCVSPDYVLAPWDKVDALAEAFKKAYGEFFPDAEPLGANSDWGKIVNPNHHARLRGILERSKGEIVIGGQNDGDRRIAPTILKNVSADDSLLEEEIFGPILPIISVDSFDEAIQFISSRPSPLVIYAFTKSEEAKQKLLEQTDSGSLTLNDTFSQLIVHEAPFGGKGDSGCKSMATPALLTTVTDLACSDGGYNGKYTFDTFSYQRMYNNIPSEAEPFMAMRYRPYSGEAYKTMNNAAKANIPTA
ncbi:aldehyde dehydrogenase [Obba rivulosa]|uniref:Aldehyde dehydrogenase n=1 Tax=Obba rivulosa TaxID=1052685 RepID=A0A8E2AVC2_9APHY|nr:aldehyde dehydrogenase [Obba rivulosa]